MCSTSEGINLFLNAERLGRTSRIQSLLLFEEAVYHMEDELENRKLAFQERMDILHKLHICYGKLSVESFLPRRYRSASLDYAWSHYIRRYSEIGEQLEQAGKKYNTKAT